MSRTRLAGAAFLFIAFLPGCGTLTGDRRTLCDRWHDFWYDSRVDACPVSYPIGQPGCAAPIPGATPYAGAPIIMGGPMTSVPGSDTFPPPGTQTMPPRIPAPKIPGGVDEGGGKQFELGPMSRTGPLGPALPTGGVK
jgi:hypothetical protein